MINCHAVMCSDYSWCWAPADHGLWTFAVDVRALSLTSTLRQAVISCSPVHAASADMERGLARLAAAASGASARDGAGIVLYEDAARRRVTALAGALRALRTLSDVAQHFKGAAPYGRREQSIVAAVDLESAERGLVLIRCVLTAEPSRISSALPC